MSIMKIKFNSISIHQHHTKMWKDEQYTTCIFCGKFVLIDSHVCPRNILLHKTICDTCYSVYNMYEREQRIMFMFKVYWSRHYYTNRKKRGRKNLCGRKREVNSYAYT